MSLSKTKMFLAVGLMMAMTLTMTGTASALDGCRLWKPYQPEQFGGSRRSGDGIYGSVEGIYWKISRPSSTYVGYTNPDGTPGTREVYLKGETLIQTNSMNMNAADASFNLGTRIEFGNYRGHHGWLISGYGLPAQTTSFSQVNASMVINDPLVVTAYAPFVNAHGYNEVFVPNSGGQFVKCPFTTMGGDLYDTAIPFVQIPQKVGYLWGWFPYTWANWDEGRLAPLPINFARATVTSNTGISSVELMYTYRPHPFKWGEMELIGGARYWEMDDEMGFVGEGYDQSIIYGTTNNNNNNNNNNSNPGETQADEGGPLTVLGVTTIDGRVTNRIGGPQFGFKLSRRNQRWTFGAEFRFMAGINSQSQTVSGVLASNFVNPENVGISMNEVPIDQTIKPYSPIGLNRNTLSFYHHANKTYFSPGVELRLNAKWQWTDAIGFNFGFNTMFVDNVARGGNIIDYSISPDGTLFGIRGNQNDAILVYGLNFGLTARR